MIADKELLNLNHRGLIPGPTEDETTFLTRIAAINALPSPSQADWAKPRAIVHALFDISPDWIPTFYSNKNLPFWQGAATWIENHIPHVQLKKGFSKGHYLRLYQRDEILAHEAVHACRMAFHEPRFEEFFAYATSSSRFRRFFGPLFATSKQSYLFLFSLLLSLAIQFLEFFVLLPFLITSLTFLPLPIFLFFFLRLLISHYTLSRCLKNIRSFVKNPVHLAYRLTDDEIALFARTPSHKISSIIEQKSSSSLRWRLLTLAYFKQG